MARTNTKPARQTAPAAPSPVVQQALTEKPADRTSKPQRSGQTCTVALKMPHGLELRLFRMTDVDEPQRDGGVKTVKQAREIPEAGRVTLNGYLKNYDPKFAPPAQDSTFALTHGVSLDFMQEWLKQNADSHIVKNNLIKIAESAADAADEAAELQGETRCGLEPLDPDKLPKNVSTFKKSAAA